MSDLRGGNVSKEVKFGLKNKIIGVALVAAVVCVVGVFFVTSSSTTAAQSHVAHPAPSAVQTNVAQ